MISLEKLHAQMVSLGMLPPDTPVTWDEVTPVVKGEQYKHGMLMKQPQWIGDVPRSILGADEDELDLEISDDESAENQLSPSQTTARAINAAEAKAKVISKADKEDKAEEARLMAEMQAEEDAKDKAKKSEANKA